MNNLMNKIKSQFSRKEKVRLLEKVKQQIQILVHLKKKLIQLLPLQMVLKPDSAFIRVKHDLQNHHSDKQFKEGFNMSMFY